MKITKGYKYRIYPNIAQAEYMNSIFGSCRFVYNHFITERSEVWKRGKKSLSYTDTSRILTLLKREPEFVWLSACDSMALQESLKDLDRAYRNFFAKRGQYPHTKSKHGCEIVPVPRFYASSQVCSCCGYKNALVKDLSVRNWVCPVCGISHDRDVNAAVNILNKTITLISTV